MEHPFLKGAPTMNEQLNNTWRSLEILYNLFFSLKSDCNVMEALTM